MKGQYCFDMRHDHTIGADAESSFWCRTCHPTGTEPKGTAGKTIDCGLGTFGIGNVTEVKTIEIVSGSSGGGGDYHVYKMDKIIQITDALTDSGDCQTLGLSERGRVYRDVYDIKSSSHRWELLLESPRL